MGVAPVLAVSVVLQFAAAMLALRLTWVARAGRAWALIAAAVFLMAVRRSITLLRLTSGDLDHPPDLAAELVALGTSILMVAGIAWIAPLFLSLRRYRKTLQQSEERYRAVADYTYDWEYWIGADGNYLYVSPSCERITGYTADEFQADPSLLQTITHVDDRDNLAAHLREELQGGRTDAIGFRIMARDGEVHWMEHACQPIYGPGETYRGTRASNRDVTDRRQAEEKAEKEILMRTILLDNLPCIAMILKKGTREIVASNESARKVGAVPGKTCYGTCVQREDPCPFCRAPEVWQDNQARRIEVEYRGVYYEAIWVPLTEDLYVHYVFDITKRRRAERKLEESLQEKDVLLREIHHRVKNNMQVMTSLLRLQARKLKSKAALEAFEETQNRIKAMALVHETLYQSEGLATFDLQRYVERVGKGLLLAYGRSNRSLDLLVDVRGVTIGVDAVVPVGLILNELISNCFKHAFPEKRAGKIRIGGRPAGEDNIELTVSDDGVGLPQEIDPHNTQTVGLGLVVGVAESQLGGSVEVARRGGTQFTITFKQRSNQKER